MKPPAHSVLAMITSVLAKIASVLAMISMYDVYHSRIHVILTSHII